MAPLFSLIVPTRGRVSGLRRLLDSLRETALEPEQTELIAVVDADDAQSLDFSYSDIPYQRVIVPPGQTMGELNLAGYRAASGQFLMLLNDDVVVRTRHWDAELQRVFTAFPDGIVLAHVNDLLFRDTLCIFPCVTRSFCDLAGGICDAGYRRYRIDDHLHNIFDFIHLLGYTRRVFLPQVVFEHGTGGHYTPNPAILDLDQRHFVDLLPARREAALEAVECIEGRSRPEQRAARARFLEGFSDSLGLRRREYAVWWPLVMPSEQAPAGRAQAKVQMALWFWAALRRPSARRLFDAAWYHARYPEVAARGERPLTHYLKTGGFQGYNPSPHFDSNWYLATNPDVAASGLNPLVHFVSFGMREGRAPKPLSDSPAIPAPVQVETPSSISVLIPTHNRRNSLLRTLQACRQHSADCDLEFIVIDDGSTDGTASLLRELAATHDNLRWQSQPPAGPARARNLAASLARHDVLLFLGDDVLPSNDDFFRVHALRHARQPDSRFAVLGKLDWPDSPDFPVNFVMRRIQQDGSQFAYARLIPGSFAGWQFFYTSNLSVKKSLVADWGNEGFDTGFPGAAFEDIELAYRLSKSDGGLRLYYDPASLGLHYHAYTLESFLERQYRAGKALRHMLDLHPELLGEFGLKERRDTGTAQRLDELKATARSVEARDLWGTESWHAEFLSALFQLALFDGYA